jgi:hypothetical protein
MGGMVTLDDHDPADDAVGGLNMVILLKRE